MSFRRFVYQTLHPAIYQGFGSVSPYFEGWYFKFVTADEQFRYAVIPGVFYGQGGESVTARDHAFVQVLDGMTGAATYHQYPIEDFWASETDFQVRVGPNYFSSHRVDLQIDGSARNISGRVYFSGGSGWPVTPWCPGAMGPFAWLPFMECYHGVVSFDHILQGSLLVDGSEVDLSFGRGYIEKDWGQAFPSAYIWQQTNHFDVPGASLMASVAVIPWIGSAFRGFTIAFRLYRKLYVFSTYTGAVIESLSVTDEQVTWVVRGLRYRLEMTSKRVEGGLLLAPVRTEMHRRVDETLKSFVQVRLTTLSGESVFSGVGRNAGLEVHGDMGVLLGLR